MRRGVWDVYIIKLSIFVGCYFYLLELAFANLKYIK